MKVIGIVGSRRRDTLADYEAARREFYLTYTQGDTIVSGGCPRGGDRFAELIALELVCRKTRKQLWDLLPAQRAQLCASIPAPITIHRADWKQGRHAGFLRNTRIAKDADVLIAVVATDRTGGTEDTINKFTMAHPHGRLIVI